MVYLLAASLLWAPSFGLIKGQLSGQLDPALVACIRLSLSLLLFAPLLRLRGLGAKTALVLLGIGALQYGVMYVLYLHAYAYLRASEVALFTIFTPLYVSVLGDLTRRRFNPLFLATALAAVVGAAIIKATELSSPTLWLGFGVMQASNLCFAVGQIAYRRVMATQPALADRRVFALLYLGASLITALAAVVSADGAVPSLSGAQIATLLYLGLGASGLGFFVWNVGARRVDVGALALFNNLKIPLALLVTLLVFEPVSAIDLGAWLRLLAGGAILVAALWFNERATKKLNRAT